MLIDEIQAEIKKAGGRHLLMYLLIVENPKAFSSVQVAHAKLRIGAIRRNRIYYLRWHRRDRTDKLEWSEADTEFLLEHYGIMKSRVLAKILGRTIIGIRNKFYLAASAEHKERVINEGRYAGRVKNFKRTAV